MRIWSLHPQYLDRQGLIACWRETLLAQKVLAGLTRGYTRHPQLDRFRALADPLAGIGTYRFDRTRITTPGATAALTVTRGQLDVEAGHLLAKLEQRSPSCAAAFPPVADVVPHPLFTVVPGPVADWERAQPTTP